MTFVRRLLQRAVEPRDAVDDLARLRTPRDLDSFTDYLPWVDYDPAHGTFLLSDGQSVGAVWEIEPVGTEGRTDRFKQELHRTAVDIISHTIPERAANPWVLQVYVNDEYQFGDFLDAMDAYRQSSCRDSVLARDLHAHLTRHFRRISQPGGAFVDADGTPWRAKRRRVRLVLYRWLGREQLPRGLTAADELNEVGHKLQLALTQAGIGSRRYGAADFYRWMVLFLNPKPPLTGGDQWKLLDLAPFPGDEDLPYGRDFAGMLLRSRPRADREAGVLYLDGCPHAIVTTLDLLRRPEIGHFTGEQQRNDRTFALFDRLPEGTVLVLTVTFEPQDRVVQHVTKIESASVGDQIEAVLAKEEAERVKRKIGLGDKLYPVETALYVHGDDERQLRERRARVASELTASGILPVFDDDEPLVLDRWFANLPMNSRRDHARRARRWRLVFSRHLGAMLPVYGRARGTGHPGFLFFNRGGEPLLFDPLNPEDRKKNAHMLILGPTGSGKSALLVYLVLMMSAVYRPRIYIVEAGNSFGLLAQHLERCDLSVHHVSLRPGAKVSLPPFADALALIERFRPVAIDVGLDGEDAEDPEEAAPEEPDAEDDRRDILGELELSARIMITGGDSDEDSRITRSDRLAIRQAILAAAEEVRAAGGGTVLPADVARCLRAASSEPGLTDSRRDRIQEMADAMALFCEPTSLAGQLFNQPGELWPDADVTIVDFATVAREGYEGELALAYVSLINRINDVIEQHQNDARHTIVITDEGHLITTNTLLARYVTKITKMWRKLGAWFWLATQNLEDFPAGAKRMLNMMEIWLLLVMPKEEVEQVARFKDINDEVRALMLATRKEKRKFVEGVIITDAVQTLFRSVPPPLALALAMTEKEEKAERARLMEAHGLASELEAAYKVAELIAGQPADDR